jgi:hypothetical protein
MWLSRGELIRVSSLTSLAAGTEVRARAEVSDGV